MRKEAKIGALLLAVIAAAIWGFNFLKGQDLFSKTLQLQAHFENVDQLSSSSPVLINGVKVGSVTEVELDLKDVNNVIVHFNIEKVSHIPKTAKAVLTSVGLMGGKALQIEFSQACSGGSDCLQDNDILQSEVKGLLSTMVNDKTMNSYVDKAKTKINELFGNGSSESDLNTMMSELKLTISNLNSMTGKINSILGSASRDVSNVTKNLSSFSNTLKDNNPKLDEILNNVAQLTTELKQANIAATVSSTKASIDEAGNTINGLKETVTKANQAIARINSIVDGVEQGKGSLGQMVNDKKLYQELVQSSNEIKLLLQDVRLNPKRYINVSVFGKKQKQYVLPEEDPAKKK